MTIGRRLAGYLGGVMALGIVAGACAPATTASAPAPAAPASAAGSSQEVASLKAQVAALQGDAGYWKQLVSIMEPVKLATMTDHRAYMLPSGVVLALHFDNMDLGKAKNLNWVALGVPGKFCKPDQERVTASFGLGFTHFHDMKNDTHGGKPGAEGVWFVHNAVRAFDAPWGHVVPGIDAKFMPTPAPAC